MRAILIDPVARTVTETEHDGNYRQIYTLLSDPEHGLKVGTFTIVELGNYDRVANTLYVDDNGLLNNPKYFFAYRDYPQPLAGRGLILGSTRGGKSRGATMTLADARERVKFGQLSVRGFETTEGITSHPIAGDNVPFIKNTPIFGPPDKD